MHYRKLIGFIFLAAPPLVWGAVEMTGYEWIWNRTDYSIATGCSIALLLFFIMSIGLKLFFVTRKKIIGPTILLGGTIFFIQIFNIGLDGFAQMSNGELMTDGRKAFSLRYAAFGTSWTDIYVTQVTWSVFRKTKHVHQYDGSAITRLQAGPEGSLEVHLSEYGKPEKIDRYSLHR